MSWFTKNIILKYFALSVCFIFLSGCDPKAEIDEGYDFAFVDVNIISFESEAEIIPRQTVLVKDGVIQNIFPSDEVIITETIPQINGGGRYYVLPGLVDAHTHVNNRDDIAWLPLFIANGVTTIFNMSGTEEILEIRDRVESGELLGPTIYTAGPLFQLPGVTTAEDAESVFNSQLSAGYDFIKVYGDLRPEAHQRIGQLGKETDGIAVVGHAPRNLPLESVLDNSQAMLAHLEEIIYTKFNDGNPQTVPDFAASVAETSNLYITPTLFTFGRIIGQWGKPEIIEKYINSDKSVFLTPQIYNDWTEANRYTSRDVENAPIKSLTFQEDVLLDFYQAGVPLLSGTDTPLPTIYPGFSVADELILFHKLGIPARDVLKIGSWNGGRFIREHVNTEKFFGAILPEYNADILLFENNPLDNINHIRTPDGVMVRGQWFSASDIAKMLTDVAANVTALPPLSDETINVYPMTIDQLKSFTGIFIQEEPRTIVEWFIKDGELYNGELDNEQKFRVVPIAENIFRFADFPVKMLAEFSEDNTRIIMTMDGAVIGDFRLQEQK